MKSNCIILKIACICFISFLTVTTITAKKKCNTIITITIDNDSIRNIVSKTDKIDVYIYHEKGGVIKTSATKNINQTFSLYIPVGLVLRMDIGYQNCCGNYRCFQINKGKEMNNLNIVLKRCETPISVIKFLSPCIMEE